VDSSSDSNSIELLIGAGASAGGNRWIDKLLRTVMPKSTSLFVIGEHMSPNADSSLVYILG